MTNEKVWKLRRSVMVMSRVKREGPAEGHEFDANLQEDTSKVVEMSWSGCAIARGAKKVDNMLLSSATKVKSSIHWWSWSGALVTTHQQEVTSKVLKGVCDNKRDQKGGQEVVELGNEGEEFHTLIEQLGYEKVIDCITTNYSLGRVPVGA